MQCDQVQVARWGDLADHSSVEADKRMLAQDVGADRYAVRQTKTSRRYLARSNAHAPKTEKPAEEDSSEKEPGTGL